MGHKAIIAKVSSVAPIEGADRIQIGVVLGETVVIGKDVSVGDIGVFFPVDLQLSEEFCMVNNLFREKEKNSDKNKAGFFDKNRRVRAQPFLGVRSCGLFMNTNSLQHTGFNSGDEVIGLEFDEWNGHKVCQKYISESSAKVKVANNTKAAKKTYAPLFVEHVDTDNFKHYSKNIKEGSLISIHAKVHGCFVPETRVSLWSGGVKKIKDIEIGDTVVGFNADGVMIPSLVRNKFYNGDTNTWLRIETEEVVKRGNLCERVICTPDHEIFTHTGFVKARDLHIGDTVKKSVKTYIPSEDQIAMMIGSHLGDGYMSKQGNMQFCHKVAHEDYLNWKIEHLSPQRIDKSVYKKSGYGSDVVFNMVSSNVVYKSLFSNVLPNEVKPWMIEKATPLTLAIIYMDDGSLSHSDVQEDRASIACCSISDIDNFVAIFNKFDIYPVVYKDNRGYSRLRFNRKDAIKLWETIREYVPDVMQYKISEEYRTERRKDISKGYDGYISKDLKVTNIISVNSMMKKYDIETETSNYVAGNVLVHNSSGRFGLTKVMQGLPWWKRAINKLKPVFPEFKYEYVVGTRRVVLKNDTSIKVGFHGSEEYRYQILESLRPFLEKGMTIYGEIAGYVNGKPIMATHSMKALKDKAYTGKYGDTVVYSYGCKEHQYRFHVYRITYTTDEGKHIDWSQKQIEHWCEKTGFIPPFEVYPQFVFDGNTEALESLVEKLTERPELLTEDYIDPSHISEGVIIRVDDGLHTPSFYKSKSYAFRVCEGHCEAADVEDAS